MLLLDHEFSIILMNKDNNGEDMKKGNEDIIKKLCLAFGGATVTNGKGYWFDTKDNNKKYIDDNIIVSVYCDDIKNWTVDQWVAVAQAVVFEKYTANQSAVTVSYDNNHAILDHSREITDFLHVCMKRENNIKFN